MTVFDLTQQALQNLQNLFTQRNLYTETRRSVGHRSIFVRHFGGGSSGDCEIEIANLFNPVYDAERFGVRLVASPRHADVLLVTGPITRRLREALMFTFEAMPDPRRIVLVGDDALGRGIFKDSPDVIGLPPELEPYIAARVPGDPPTPQAMLNVLLQLPTK
ncbi:MAG TPA: oxidoreductase [Anaerolineae bacterium]|nr:oxidoreductase [Anaerolineae bacterium]